MITQTSLKHPSVRREIIRSVVNVIRGYSVDHARNSKGRAFIAIRGIPADNGCGSVMHAIDRNGRDVTSEVAEIVKEYINRRKNK